MARAKSRLREALPCFSLARKNKPTSTNQQTESTLFNVPRELREKIWFLALTSVRHASPHFHFYDTVYDSCTYAELDERNKRRRQNPKKISLLLTCRAAYFEAAQFLYDDTDFTLVLFAGRARPADDLSGRNCIGRISACEKLFSRMRKVTLVIQPGKQPDAAKYVARLAQLLRIMKNCENVKDLCLHFNFHSTFLSLKGGSKRLEAIMQAFYPLKKREERLLIQTCAFWGNPNPVEPFNNLLALLPGAKIQPWHHTEKTNPCMVRGTFGSPDPSVDRSAMTRKERALDTASLVTVGATYLALLPVSLPMTYWYSRKRKIDKGER